MVTVLGAFRVPPLDRLTVLVVGRFGEPGAATSGAVVGWDNSPDGHALRESLTPSSIKF